jgi:hypothetical protein
MADRLLSHSPPKRRRRPPPSLTLEAPIVSCPQAAEAADAGGGGGALPVKGRRVGEDSAEAHHGRWWGTGWGCRAVRSWWPRPDALRWMAMRSWWHVLMRPSSPAADRGLVRSGPDWAVASATPATWCSVVCRLFLHYHFGWSD